MPSEGAERGEESGEVGLRMCPTISSTSSKPRATICRPHYIPSTAVAQPNDMPVLANIYQILLSLVCLQFLTLTLLECKFCP